MHGALDRAAERKEQQRNDESDKDQPPQSEAAYNSDTGREPDAGGAGEALYLRLIGVDDYARAEKSDSGQQPLNDPACSVGQPPGFQRGGACEQHDSCGGKADEAQRAKADRLAMQIPVQANNSRRQRRDAEPQDDVPPVKHVNRPLYRAGCAYAFGTRPII